MWGGVWVCVCERCMCICVCVGVVMHDTCDACVFACVSMCIRYPQPAPLLAAIQQHIFVCICTCVCVCLCVCARARCIRICCMCTGWRRPTEYLIFIWHFPQKSPTNSGSFAKRDLRLETSYASSPPCIRIFTTYLCIRYSDSLFD